MALDGIFGRAEALDVLGIRGAAETSERIEGGALGFCACDTTLLTASGTAVGSGGGNGETDMLVTEAWWA